MQDNDQIIDEVTSSDYKYGFTTDIDTETIGKGLSEETVRLISEKKGEPEWLLQFRLEAYRHWLTLEQPDWALLKIPLSTTRISSTMPLRRRRRARRASTR